MYAIEVRRTSKVLLILSKLPLFVNLDLGCMLSHAYNREFFIPLHYKIKAYWFWFSFKKLKITAQRDFIKFILVADMLLC